MTRSREPRRSPLRDVPTLLARAGAPADRERARADLLPGPHARGRAHATASSSTAWPVRRGTCATRSAFGAATAVAVLSPNRLEVPVLLLALMRLGARVVPLNPTAPPEDWAYILAHSGARGALRHARAARRGSSDGRPRTFARSIDERRRARRRRPSALRRAAADVARRRRRSSSTPRAPPATQGRGAQPAQPPRQRLEHGARTSGSTATTQLAVLPLYHAHALRLRPDDRAHHRRPPRLHRAVRSVRLGGGHPRRVGRGHERRPDAAARCSCRRASPRAGARPARASWSRRRRSPPTLARDFEDADRHPARPGLGPLGVHQLRLLPVARRSPTTSAARLLLGGEVPSHRQPARRAPRSRCVDADGATLPPKARAASSACAATARCSRYFHDPEATRAAFDRDGWLRTGDEGFFALDGGQPVFFITGRIKEIIIRGGEKYSPLAIERALSAARPELDGTARRARLPPRGPRRGDRRLPRERRRSPTSCARGSSRRVEALPVDAAPEGRAVTARRRSRAPTPARSSGASCSRCSRRCASASAARAIAARPIDAQRAEPA